MNNKLIRTIISVLVLTLLISLVGFPVSAKKNENNPLSATVPVLVAPSGTITNTNPTFSWSRISLATQYQLQLLKNAKTVYTKTIPNSSCGVYSNCMYTPGVILSGGVYSWKVRAMTSKGWYTYSAVKSFTYPTTPTPLIPGESIADITPNFTWTTITGASQYQFQLYRGSTHIYDKAIGSSSCGSGPNCTTTPIVVLIPGDYMWKVQANVDGKWSAYSAWLPFTISADPGEMVSIPAGSFQMGCSPTHNGGLGCSADELPLHLIYTRAFQMDKYEVTNAQYAHCVYEGGCDAPTSPVSRTRGSYYNNPAFGSYPVIYVTWYDAANYCSWADKHLPTEAEWERAARGSVLRAFPWGDGAPICSLANFKTTCFGDIGQVGNYPAGASTFGVLDMSGNAWEWVQDWYQPDYYSTSPGSNPTGPESGIAKVNRGGAWNSISNNIRIADRSAYNPGDSFENGGFRCAK